MAVITNKALSLLGIYIIYIKYIKSPQRSKRYIRSLNLFCLEGTKVETINCKSITVAMQKEQKEHSSLDAACEIKFLLSTFRLTSSKVPLDIGEGSSHLI